MVPHPNVVSILKTLIIIWVACLPKPVTAQLPTSSPNFFITTCYNTTSGTYTQNSVYHNNLNSVLTSMVAHASTAPFYNSSAGLSDGPDAAYGQYYCRADISSKLCQDCVTAATQNVSVGGACFGKKEGVVYYQECQLRYANQSMFAVEKEWPESWWSSLVNVSDPVKFDQVLGNVMDTIIQKAAYGSGVDGRTDLKGFAIGEGNVTQFEQLYCLVQCSPDITGLPCENCLRSALRFVGKCCGYEVEWVFVNYPSCQIRYSLSRFYNISITPSPEPANIPTASPPADHHSQDRRGDRFHQANYIG